MKATIRLRLYPNRKQEQKLVQVIEAGRRLWNDALAHRKRRWEKNRLTTTYSQQCWILTAERRSDPMLGLLYAQAAQEILRRLDRAFKAFFDHRASYPRFKSPSESGSFTYPQAYRGSVKPILVRKKFFLSKVGYVNVIFHRELPTSQEKLKTCTVTREKNGDWYASLVYENFRDSSPIPARFTKPVGVDLGLNSLVTATDGVKIHHTRILRRFERRLKRLQADFSRTQRGSKNRVKEAQTAGSPVFEGVKATRRLQS